MSEPVSVQHLLGSTGAPAEIHVGPTVWKVGHPDQRAKARLEELVTQFARRELAANGAIDQWVARVEEGAYRTRADGWSRVMRGPSADCLFLLSLLREHHPNASLADAESLAAGEPEQVRAAIVRVAPAFFGLVLADLSLPPAEKERAIAEAVQMFTHAISPKL